MYACDMRNGDDITEIFNAIVENESHDSETVVYAGTLVTGTCTARSTIDVLLQKHIANWDLKRLAAIDRNILRLAITELGIIPEVPFKVVIDEAVEIAKEFGTDDSGKFVNGVIDSIYRELHNENTAGTPPADGLVTDIPLGNDAQ
jgi:N utilization substance protein B